MQIDINLKEKSRDYKIYIDEEILLNLKGKVAIITNETIAPLWLEKFKNHIKCDELVEIIIKDGEEYKKIDTILEILDRLFVARFDRSSTLIALGGGVISDMVGFVASIYERGIEFINIPTTLLSQIDASVGGKTGINNKFGKNLVGAFYQPKAVYCNTQFLTTLDQRQVSAGMAEAIKMAVMFDKKFFEFIAETDFKKSQNIAKLIQKCVQIKAEVVAKDEKEKGIRAVLNYGHTFGHVIENQTFYKIYLHGEAVSMGMSMANELALSLGLINESQKAAIKAVLKKFSLPTKYKIPNIDEFYEAFYSDKKSQNSKIKFILPKGIGNFVIVDDIPKELVLDVLKGYK
ncbi:MAG: 3-dehydroquinate synthase [Campylobacter sp.]|nr:3-dehydroquinate synthase [Campylobacter sp.]